MIVELIGGQLDGLFVLVDESVETICNEDHTSTYEIQACDQHPSHGFGHLITKGETQ